MNVRPIRFEQLEDRLTPAIFGQPWLDGQRLTMSFAGDGTSISGVASNLSTAFASLGSDVAKLEVLRAFQTWAINANLNIGLVADSDLAFGTPGALQGDPRFGDIRVGARTLAGDVITITAPFSLLTPNSGDIIVNSTKNFALGGGTNAYDLFTVFMQEAGHAYGIGNSMDSASVMFEQYGITRAGLSSGDIANIRSLYGSRNADSFEGTSGNQTLLTATTYSGTLEADLTTASDEDVYRYIADSSDSRWFRIKASGLSLVAAKLEVLDGLGQVVGSAQALSPLQNDVTVHMSELVAGATYYLRVSSATTSVFGVGAYRLAADITAAGVDPRDPYALADTEAGVNDALPTATQVTPTAGPHGYSFRSTLSSSTDVDYFSVRSPINSNGTTNLTINVSAVGATPVRPVVEVYSAAGIKLAVKTLAETNSSVVLSLAGTAANTDYIIRIANASGTSGNYDFVATFDSAATPAMMGSTGRLEGVHQSTSATLNVLQSQTIQINQVASVQGATGTVSRVRIYDSLNRIVFELFSNSEQSITGQVFLARGYYRVEVQNLTTSAMDFSLTLFGVSDPIGSESTDPTLIPAGDPTTVGTPPPPPPPDDTTTLTLTPPVVVPPLVVWF